MNKICGIFHGGPIPPNPSLPLKVFKKNSDVWEIYLFDFECFEMSLYDTANANRFLLSHKEYHLDVSSISTRYLARWKGGVRIGKIFVLIYLMFQGILISLKGFKSLVQKEHRGLWSMNAAWPVIGWGSEMQASHWSLTFIDHKAFAPFNHLSGMGRPLPPPLKI